MSKIFAISDLHIDQPSNYEHVFSFSPTRYLNDTLIVAGDVTDCLDKLAKFFETITKKFHQVVFVPGNHELWLRRTPYKDSLEKFFAVLELCKKFGISTSPIKITRCKIPVWIVPLFSWYRGPDDGETSLYIEKISDENKTLLWMDNRLCKWPEQADIPADFFLALNKNTVGATYDAPIISVSHFLPRRELIFGPIEMARHYADGTKIIEPHPLDPHPFFNFSRVAGCSKIDDQIRRLSSTLHIYGHQHRNRHRHIEGVTYISHCLGNVGEIKTQAEPLEVWGDEGALDWLDKI